MKKQALSKIRAINKLIDIKAQKRGIDSQLILSSLGPQRKNVSYKSMEKQLKNLSYKQLTKGLRKEITSLNSQSQKELIKSLGVRENGTIKSVRWNSNMPFKLNQLRLKQYESEQAQIIWDSGKGNKKEVWDSQFRNTVEDKMRSLPKKY